MYNVQRRVQCPQWSSTSEPEVVPSSPSYTIQSDCSSKALLSIALLCWQTLNANLYNICIKDYLQWCRVQAWVLEWMTTMKRRCIAMSKPDRCIIESKVEQDHNQGSIFNLLATVPTQLQQQWKKRLVQYSASGWNQIRLRCVSVPSTCTTGCSGGEGAVSVVARKFPEKISVDLFSESEQEAAGQWVLPAAVKEVIVPQNPFLHLPLLLLRADLKLGPRFCTPLVKLW